MINKTDNIHEALEKIASMKKEASTKHVLMEGWRGLRGTGKPGEAVQGMLAATKNVKKDMPSPPSFLNWGKRKKWAQEFAADPRIQTHLRAIDKRTNRAKSLPSSTSWRAQH